MIKNKTPPERDYRESLFDILPEDIYYEIIGAISQASVCWEHPEQAGIFDASQATEIAYDLCHYIADALENAMDYK